MYVKKMGFFEGGKGKRAMVNDNTDSSQFSTHPTGGSLPSFPFPATHTWLVKHSQIQPCTDRPGWEIYVHIITKSKKKAKKQNEKETKKKKKKKTGLSLSLSQRRFKSPRFI